MFFRVRTSLFNHAFKALFKTFIKEIVLIFLDKLQVSLFFVNLLFLSEIIVTSASANVIS